MDSEYEYESDEDIRSNDESESEVDEISVENLPTLGDRITISEPARTMKGTFMVRAFYVPRQTM